MKKLVGILSCLLYYQIYIVINIEHISLTKSGTETYLNKNSLELNKEYNEIYLPHLNVKGNVVEYSEEKLKIEFPEISQEFLETQFIEIKNSAGLDKLKNIKKVFVVFRDILVEKKYIKI